MQVTNAYSSQNTRLRVYIGTSPGGGYVDVPQIKGLEGPSNNWDIADITCLSSPNNRKEKKPLMADPGTVPFDLIYDPDNATHEFLRASNGEATLALELFKIILPPEAGEQEIVFSAYVTKFQFKNQQGQVGMVSVELTLTGDVDFNT